MNLWGLTRAQTRVLLAAWIGWGFDVFDGMLFNLVAPTCVPTLLGIALGTPEAQAATMRWTGPLTSLLLVGWAIGGALFGKVADRVGRRRTMLLTILVYSIGTGACALAPNLWVFAACRFVAALGLGGEWAAGASMVAEVVPDERRVEAGVLLQTAAPLGLLSITLVNWGVAGHLLAASPSTSWRVVFLFALLPAAATVFLRRMVTEPERWQQAAPEARRARIRDLFDGPIRRATWSGLVTNTAAQLTWWSTYAFIPIIAAGLAKGAFAGVTGPALVAAIESWKAWGTGCFNVGGLIGTLLLIPVTRRLGRRGTLALYFVSGAVALAVVNGLALEPMTRLTLNLAVGMSVYGVIGAFAFYLPELFPTRLRGTGAGFCFNAGRILAAFGPFIVGQVASSGHALEGAMQALLWVALVPLGATLLLPTVVETAGTALAD